MTGNVKRAVAELRNRPLARLRLKEETRVRLAAAALWVLIATAAVGGIVGLVRPPATAPAEPTPAVSPAATVSEAWAAGGFGARAVAAYLAPGDDTDGEGAFAGFLGDDPAGTDRVAADAPPVAVVAVDRAGEHYWAVTVAAGETGREQFWRVGIASGENGRLVATGPPTPVAAPPVAERPELAVTSWETPPADDPVVETVTGWIAAYACGQGDVSRWLAPGVRVDAVTPPLCSEARLDRWGTQPDGDDRLVVMTEAALDPGASEQRVTFALALSERDGRWEVTELLAAPPLNEEVND